MPVSAEEYQALLQREMERFNPGGDPEGEARDQAVRSANIAAGYGNSTALQQQAPAAAAAAGEAPAGVPVPTARPSPIESLFLPRPELPSGPSPEFPQYFGEQPPPPQFPEFFGEQPPPPQFPQYFGEQPPPPQFPQYFGQQPQPPQAFRPHQGVQPPVGASAESPVDLTKLFG
jgi:hypothetical protein